MFHKGQIIQWPMIILSMVIGFQVSGGRLLAGKLSDFEEAATRERSRPPTRRSHPSDVELGSFLGTVLAAGMAEVFSDSFNHTMDRVRPYPLSVSGEWQPRDIGDPDLPFVRLDINYQRVSSNIRGWDGRLEGGYGPFAVSARHTRYREKEPRDNLYLTNIHGLWRISFSRAFEFNLGMGAIILQGEERNSGFSVTYPLNVYPFRYLGLRFVPTWSWIAGNTISDYDGSVSFAYRYLSLRVGYRWLKAGSQTIDGPYLGASLHF